ncbi:MAG TPA: RIP metalloprotease RseP [Candidatus Acidoferrum sp.]|nr:RIP metalloprotease RseP [Candidatus Acidoferrum sp.]
MGHIFESLTSAGYILGAIFALGLIVVIHEFGHFVVARYFGVRVDVFSFGFGPRLLGIKRGPTDYRISALPFGGYVRMAGDNPSEERAGAPDEFLSKPRWQRALIAVAGPSMNCILAVVIYSVMFGGPSVQPIYSDKPIMIAYVHKDSPADKAGIHAGDTLVSLNGVENPTWDRVRWETELSAPNVQIPVTIDRQGQLITTSVVATFEPYEMFGYPPDRIVVDYLSAGMPALKAGLRPGDQIMSANGEPIECFAQLTQVIEHNEDRPLQIGVLRNGHDDFIQVRPIKKDLGDGFGPRWSIGFSRVMNLDTHTVDRGALESIKVATWYSARMSQQFMVIVGQLFVGKASPKEFLGPLGIVTISGRVARHGIGNLSRLMALISLNLAVLNLLPIPILDGGHILMLSVEGLLRHDLSLKTKERFIQVGFVFILIIFAFVMYNDVLRLFTHS